MRQLSDRALAWVRAGVFIACLVPLVRLAVLGYGDRLTANPIEFITRSTGTWTLVMLLATLAVTPLRRALGWPWLIRIRRMLGLYAFFYGCLHLVTYLWLDQFFDLNAIVRDILKRPFITMGFAGFVLMLPLALTSTNAMMRRLGGRRWQRLHRLVYLIPLAGVIHYWWLVKSDITEPALYGAALVALLAARLWRRSAQPRGMARN